MTLIARTEDQRRIAQDRLTQYVSSAQGRAGGALQRVMTEVPQDQIVKASAFDFVPRSGRIAFRTAEPRFIHANAMQQIAGRQEIPMAYINHLTDTARQEGGAWALELLARTLTEHHQHDDARYLVRSVGNEARAVLSDKFRRIDCRPGLDALAQVAQSFGAVAGDAIATDTRVSVKFVVPRVLEPTPGEFLVFGLDWSNSDYGRGAQTLRTFLMRLSCWNGAVLETAIRQVHLGARLSDDVSYSEQTYALDARATVSAISDTARALLSDASVEKTVGIVAAAANEKIDPKAKIVELRKKVGKGLADQVGEAFNRPDVEDLPAGNTAWRWSNALSWVAGHSEDPEVRIDLERAAGEALRVAA